MVAPYATLGVVGKTLRGIAVEYASLEIRSPVSTLGSVTAPYASFGAVMTVVEASTTAYASLGAFITAEALGSKAAVLVCSALWAVEMACRA